MVCTANKHDMNENKRGRGRPKELHDTVTICLTMERAAHERIAALVEKGGKSEFIRKAVAEKLERENA